jgi:hypothetical protein
MNLGVDIGRVIIAPGDDGDEDTSFLHGSLEDALRTPPMEGAFDAIRRLVETFGDRVWLVSKCGPRIQDRTRHWLEHHGFHEKTGLSRDRVVFCLQRRQKADHCAQLGIEAFIDDRLDVLEAMRGHVAHLFWFGEDRGSERAPKWLTAVRDWDEAVEAVLGRL